MPIVPQISPLSYAFGSVSLYLNLIFVIWIVDFVLKIIILLLYKASVL